MLACVEHHPVPITKLRGSNRQQRKHLPQRRNLWGVYAEHMRSRIRMQRNGVRDRLRIRDLPWRLLLRPEPALPAAESSRWIVRRDRRVSIRSYLPRRRLLSIDFLPNVSELRRQRTVHRSRNERSRPHRDQLQQHPVMQRIGAVSGRARRVVHERLRMRYRQLRRWRLLRVVILPCMPQLRIGWTMQRHRRGRRRQHQHGVPAGLRMRRERRV